MNLFYSHILPFLAFFSSVENAQIAEIDGPVIWGGIDSTHAEYFVEKPAGLG